jgi:ankyrin repeat protein
MTLFADNYYVHFAIKNRNVKELRELLSINALDVNFNSERHGSHLHYAVKRNNYEIIELLLQHHAKVDTIDVFGQIPLNLISKDTTVEIILLLLKYGSNLNQRSYLGQTPLHSLVLQGSYETARVLFEAGASPDIISFSGLSARLLLKMQNKPELEGFFD